MSYFGAYAYCRATGGRLATTQEWQALAGGREGRLYPWGDSFAAQRGAWPYRDGALNAAQICGLHPSTDTPDGVHDLANGVLEWSIAINDADNDTAPKAAVHGALPGGDKNRAIGALNATWHHLDPSTRSHQLGFRCAYWRKPKQQTPWNTKQRTYTLKAGEYRIGLPTDARLPRLLRVLPPEKIRAIGTLGRSGADEWSVEVTRCEISRKRYRLFLRDPLVALGLFANESEPGDTSYKPARWEEQLQNPELPVVGVNWWAADAFARWAGGRLPSSDEWRLISSGQDARQYPWGDSYDPNYSMNAEIVDAQISACGSFEHDVSDGGVLDMAANVSEWTRSITAGRGGYLMWVKGGSYLLPGEETAQVDFARAVPLDHHAQDIGIRVVFD
jgi:formylglycine-generating enzyme required for sulfatase activity